MSEHMNEQLAEHTDGLAAEAAPEEPELTMEQAEAEVDEELARYEAALEAAQNVFTSSEADIPAGARKLDTVRNRPYTYGIIALVALGVLAVMFPQFWIALAITAAVAVALTFFAKNDPVIDVYEGFMVCHKSQQPEKVCIIPNERIHYWKVVEAYSSIIQVYFEDPELMHAFDGLEGLEGQQPLRCANVHSLNAFRVEALLKKHYAKKELSEVRRGDEPSLVDLIKARRAQKKAEREARGK